MPPRASQRAATQQSRSQPNGRRAAPAASQAKGKGKRRQQVEEEEEEEEERVDDDDEDMNEDEDRGNTTEKLANDLVRLALFTEYKHVPLRRDEINKKVLGKHTRQFRTVFDEAQRILIRIFGMELEPLPTQSQRDKPEGAAEENGEGTGVKKKAANTQIRAWVLRNMLKPAIIKAAAEMDADLQQVENEDWDNMPEEIKPAESAAGTLIGWQTADEVGLMGLLFVILSLILVNGRSVPDMQLRAYLKKLKVLSNTELPTSPAGKPYTLDTYLNMLVKLNYLDRTRNNLGAIGSGSQPAPSQGGGRGNRRSRGNDDGDDGDFAYEWRWGTRADVEIGEKAVADFVCDVYQKRRDGMDAIQEESDDDDDEAPAPAKKGRGSGGQPNGARQSAADKAAAKRKAKESREKKELDRLMREVERAAGGSLMD